MGLTAPPSTGRAGVLLIVDVDGTLVSDTGEPNAGAIELFSLRSPDVRVGLATARPARGVRWLAEYLGGIDFAVCLQGALILDGDLTTTNAESVTVGRRAASRVCGLAGELDVWAYTAESWFVSGFDDAVERETELMDFGPDGRLEDADPALILKFVCHGSELGLSGLRRVARECDLVLVDSIYSPTDTFVEVVSESVPRAKGLSHVQSRLAANGDIVVAVGDGYNDVEMLRLADVGFTFADSPLADSHEFSILPPTSAGGLRQLREELRRLQPT